MNNLNQKYFELLSQLKSIGEKIDSLRIEVNKKEFLYEVGTERRLLIINEENIGGVKYWRILERFYIITKDGKFPAYKIEDMDGTEIQYILQEAI